ncbi:cyclic nucleotide-binding domain-containing protein [Candidatus Poribacteria bacterium]|nr:cyclic nucleotide-binding domain-containing protein [Candidatus Poribacteria bacterium]
MQQPLDQILSEHSFLKGLRSEDLEMMAGCATMVRFDKGDFLFRENSPADRFYILRHGNVALELHSPQGGAFCVMTLGEGEVVGWSWLTPPYRFQFDARALDLVRAISLDGSCLRQKCEEDPHLGYELMKRFATVFAERLHATRMQLLDIYGEEKSRKGRK